MARAVYCSGASLGNMGLGDGTLTVRDGGPMALSEAPINMALNAGRKRPDRRVQRDAGCDGPDAFARARHQRHRLGSIVGEWHGPVERAHDGHDQQHAKAA